MPRPSDFAVLVRKICTQSPARGGVKLFPQCIAIWALHYILLIFRHSSLIVRLACVVFAGLLTD